MHNREYFVPVDGSHEDQGDWKTPGSIAVHKQTYATGPIMLYIHDGIACWGAHQKRTRMQTIDSACS